VADTKRQSDPKRISGNLRSVEVCGGTSPNARDFRNHDRPLRQSARPLRVCAPRLLRARIRDRGGRFALSPRELRTIFSVDWAAAPAWSYSNTYRRLALCLLVRARTA